MDAKRYQQADTIAELRAEIAWLRAELGYRDERIPRISEALGLSQQQAHIVSILYGARSRWVLRSTIDDTVRIIPSRAKRITGTVDAQVCKTRRKLGWPAIDTDGEGNLGALRLSVALVERLDLVFSAPERRT